MDDLNKKNLRLGLVLGGVALLMFVLMVAWAAQYMSMPT
jgi:hypothetical protein